VVAELNGLLDEYDLDTETFEEETGIEIEREILELFSFHGEMWKTLSALSKKTGAMSYKPTILSYLIGENE
jgi:hypothetical protein